MNYIWSRYHPSRTTVIFRLGPRSVANTTILIALGVFTIRIVDLGILATVPIYQNYVSGPVVCWTWIWKPILLITNNFVLARKTTKKPFKKIITNKVLSVPVFIFLASVLSIPLSLISSQISCLTLINYADLQSRKFFLNPNNIKAKPLYTLTICRVEVLYNFGQFCWYLFV